MIFRIRRPWSTDKAFEVDLDEDALRIRRVIAIAALEEGIEPAGVGDFVWHAPFLKKFWCIFMHDKVLFLVIGNDLFRLDEVTLTLKEHRITCDVFLQTQSELRRYVTLQPWITKPLIILDCLSYDQLDREMASFVFYLLSNLHSAEWQHQQWPSIRIPGQN